MSRSVCICGLHLERGYSGGRYHAWILGEALAASGASVTLWTNAVPQYATDFDGYPAHQSIVCHVDADFLRPPPWRFDWVVVIPDGISPLSVYERWLLLAHRERARVALLNFESPNWFNTLSGSRIEPSLWLRWTTVSRFCDVIISSADESTRYAREFYTEVPRWCRFSSCPPSINSRIADAVDAPKKERQICVIARLGGSNYAHKGGFDLVEAICPGMAGFELVFLVGIAAVQEGLLVALKARAAEHNVTLRFLDGVNDREKFTEIKRSRLMLFLSRFEGFGYPPVESLYCGTPCIVYDLPVLREISGEGLVYVPAGAVAALRQAISRVLEGPVPDGTWLRAQVERVASFDSFVVRISETFEPTVDTLAIRALPLRLRFRCEAVRIRTRVRRWTSGVQSRLSGFVKRRIVGER
jgi:glycosyltransferase involved in cell wall biosynthesis